MTKARGVDPDVHPGWRGTAEVGLACARWREDISPEQTKSKCRVRVCSWAMRWQHPGAAHQCRKVRSLAKKALACGARQGGSAANHSKPRPPVSGTQAAN